MIEAAKRFVCAADEVWRLQRGSEADCVYFQQTVNNGERITDRGSRQGMWILAPGGVVLASINSRDVDKVLKTLDEGFAAWNALDPERMRIPESANLDPEHRWEDSLPEDGLVLERIARELHPRGLASKPHPRWNRDYVWFDRNELAAFAQNADVLFLPVFAERLARFHLVDNPRGQTIPFAKEELVDAKLSARVVARSGTQVRFVLEGHTRADSDGSWKLGQNSWKPKREMPHGIECDLLGEATFDLATRRFEAFELVAIAQRWGRTLMNGRTRQSDPGLVAFHLSMAKDPPRIAPAFISVYDADWVTRPEVETWLESPEECGLKDE